MNSLEATDMAVRILGRFQGPPADAWEEVLHDVPAGVAGTALARLTREHDKRWLSIAEFLNMVRQVQPYDASNRLGAQTCEACSDSGWIEADDFVEPAGPIESIPAKVAPDGTVTTPARTEQRPVTYSQVRPCACREGRARAQSSVWREQHPAPRSAA
jgi:hypothetical protein